MWEDAVHFHFVQQLSVQQRYVCWGVLRLRWGDRAERVGGEESFLIVYSGLSMGQPPAKRGYLVLARRS